MFTYSRSSFSNTFVLSKNEIEVASISYSGWSNKARINKKHEQWIFKSKGWFSNTYFLYNATEELILEVQVGRFNSKSQITLATGEMFFFDSSNFFHTKYEIHDRNGNVIEFEKQNFWSGTEGSIISRGLSDDKIELLSITALALMAMNRVKSQAAT